MATWSLGPTRETVHGVFSSEFAPVLTVESGDMVMFQTPDPGWGHEARNPANPDTVPRSIDDFIPERRGSGHCLLGPVAISGAKPGMTLEIRIEEIRTGTWGWTSCRPGPFADGAGLAKGEWAYLAWTLDPDREVGRNNLGHEVDLHPFLGVMGMPPGEPGMHSTIPPRRTGGNLDCKELTVGSSLFLPIEVPDCLFSIGDGHARQGDGEVCGTAIECPMERVSVTFFVHEQMSLHAPRARIPGAWITFGIHEDLDMAAYAAVEDMVSLLCEQHPVERPTALSLASVAVDLRVTQYVNQVKGVHAILRDGAIRFG